MISITLPDGNVRQLPQGATAFDLANNISKSLAKVSIAARIDGELRDLTLPLHDGAKVAIITRDMPEALEIIRHDAAHVMAEAVQALYPGTQVTIGPAIENGFYYDFARDTPFTPEDLEKIEAKMRQIIAADRPFTREVWDRNKAIQHFEGLGEKYKAIIIQDLPSTETITIYRQGDWYDLCRGPHLPSTGKIGNGFKLMRVAGAYWRGDAKNAQLQRIYGTAWRNEVELKAHLTQLEEAEKRDHRRLGKEMELFHLQDDAAGSIFWHPHGWTLYRTLENYIRARIQQDGYVEVKTPQLVNSSMFIKSGHWDMYGDKMFRVVLDEETMFGIKPMNCPCHVQVYNQGMKSYRDLPIRMAEFGSCHRNEPSGSLHGIMRVRGFVQDDAHIFCREDQVMAESLKYCAMQMKVYEDLGFPTENVTIKLALRPDVRGGTDEIWDKAEDGLRKALTAAGMTFEEIPNEGAFYGPKIEFHLTDAIGRVWQCGTLQLDFVLPERLDAHYIGEDGNKHRPVMLHRAMLGSMERFIGIMIEHFSGKFPLWLAPLQVVVAGITNDMDDYTREVLAACKAAGLRADIDIRNEKINYKIREHSLKKVPLMLVVGKKEAENRTVALRRLGGENQELLSLSDAIAKLKDEAKTPLEK
ncbi:MAG: threonine--tRNA ligase [Alphaproteobacteria bacterium]|nr:threonine--tRNA ligase [Alphaproteobacteria bacterium]